MGDHAQFWTTGTSRNGRFGFRCARSRDFRQPRQNIVNRAAKIEVDRPAVIVEHKDLRIFVPVERLFGRTRDRAGIAGGDTAVTREGDEGHTAHENTSASFVGYYPGKLRLSITSG